MSVETTAVADVGKALELIPSVTSAITTAQSDIATDDATHQSIVSTGLQMAGLASTSLTALANSGAVGHNDASNINAGVTAAESALGLAGELEAIIAKIKSAFSWL